MKRHREPSLDAPDDAVLRDDDADDEEERTWAALRDEFLRPVFSDTFQLNTVSFHVVYGLSSAITLHKQWKRVRGRLYDEVFRLAEKVLAPLSVDQLEERARQVIWHMSRQVPDMFMYEIRVHWHGDPGPLLDSVEAAIRDSTRRRALSVLLAFRPGRLCDLDPGWMGYLERHHLVAHERLVRAQFDQSSLLFLCFILDRAGLVLSDMRRVVIGLAQLEEWRDALREFM